MSKLRPECQPSNDPVLPDDTALFLIRDAVLRRHMRKVLSIHDIWQLYYEFNRIMLTAAPEPPE